MSFEDTTATPEPPRQPMTIARVILLLLLALPLATAVFGIVIGTHETVVLVMTAAIGSSLAIIGFAMRGGFRQPGQHPYPELDMPDDEEFGAALREEPDAQPESPPADASAADVVDAAEADSASESESSTGQESAAVGPSRSA